MKNTEKRKYFNECSKEVIIAREVADSQFLSLSNECLDYNFAIYFMLFNITIVDPFRDRSGTASLTLDEAYELYGTSTWQGLHL